MHYILALILNKLFFLNILDLEHQPKLCNILIRFHILNLGAYL